MNRKGGVYEIGLWIMKIYFLDYQKILNKRIGENIC